MQHLLKHYQRDRSSFEERGAFPRQASVLLALTDHPTEPDIVLTKRASHLSQHAGEVSFPGGKWEEQDQSLIETALRETHEEIGIAPELVQVLNVEPFALNRNGMRVTPFVGVVPHELSFTPCPEEIDAVFRVPVQFFMGDPRYRTDLYVLAGKELWSPAYKFENFDIWGLTSRILVGFLNRALHANIPKESNAPIRVRPKLPASDMIPD